MVGFLLDEREFFMSKYHYITRPSALLALLALLCCPLEAGSTFAQQVFKSINPEKGLNRSGANLEITYISDAIGAKNYGSSVTYTATVTNNDAIIVNDIAVEFILPSQVLLNLSNPSQGTYDSGSGVWSVGSIAAGGNATIALAVTVNAQLLTSELVVSQATITNPSVLAAYDASAQATFGLQRYCSANNYGLIQESMVVTDGLMSATAPAFWTINGNVYAVLTLSIDPLTELPVLVQYVTDPNPDISFLCALPGSGTTSFSWLTLGSATFIVAGSNTSGSQIQLYQFDATQPDCSGLTELQTIDTGVTVNAVAWISMNSVPYLVAGCASNQLLLYGFDGSSTLTLMQTVTLENNYAGSMVEAVNTLDWHVVDGTAYLAVGLQAGSFVDDNPLLQLYVLQNAYMPQLMQVFEERSTVASESITTVSWNVIDGTSFLAVGEQQPVQSNSKPEVVRLYQLDAAYMSGSLINVYSVPTSAVDGSVASVSWNGPLLAVSGLLGTRDAYNSFSDGEKLLLCEFSNVYAPMLSVIDRVSTIVLEGDVLNTAWVPNTSILLAAGEMVDNGTSGPSDARFYALCYNADISVANTVSDLQPRVGETITYTITAINNTASIIFDVQVNESLAAGLTFVSAEAAQGSFDEVTGLWTIGTLMPYQQTALTVQVTVDPSVGGWSLVSTASISAPNVVITDADGSASVTINVQLPLVVTKAVDMELASAGDLVTFAITATNNSIGIASNTAVHDVLPSELIFISASATKGMYDNVAGVWSIGVMEPSEAQTLTLVAQVAPGQSSTVLATNVAAISDIYGIFDVYGNTAQANLGIQQSCSTLADKLLEQTRVGTISAQAIPYIVWPASQGGLLGAAITRNPYPQGSQLVVVVYDETGKNFTPLCQIDLAGEPTSLEWLDVQGTSYIMVGVNGGIQVFSVQMLYTGSLSLVQTIDMGTDALALSSLIINDQAYLAVGLANNRLQLYAQNMSSSVLQWEFVEEIVVDAAYGSSVVAVPALKWRVAGNDTFLAVGLAGGITSDTNPVLHLYRFTGDQSNMLELLHEVFSTIASEQVAALDWTTINGVTYLAAGHQQVEASVSKPEPVRLYQLNGAYESAVLDEVHRVAVSDIDGLVSTCAWNGLYLLVGGELGVRVGVGFTQGDPLRLCKFIDMESPALTQIDSASTIVMDGVVAAVAWWPVSGSNVAVVTGDAFIDNGTSGSSQARVCILCAAECDLAIVQLVDNVSPMVGEVVNYTITLQNQGPNNLDDLLVSDSFPANMVFVKAAATQGTYEPQSGLWNIGSMSPGARAQLVLTGVTGASSLGRSLTNTAYIVGGCPSNPYSGFASTTINVQPCVVINTPQAATITICSQ